MARTLASPRFVRALVSAGIITEEQCSNCESAEFAISKDQLPRVTITLILDFDQFSRLMPEEKED